MSQISSRGILRNTWKNAVALVISMSLVGCQGFVNGKAYSETAIAQFHEHYNQSKFEEIWKGADPRFRDAGKRETYDQFMAKVRGKLGQVVKSSESGFNIQQLNMETICYITEATTFENGEGVEQFSFKINGNQALLVGYNVNSNDLIN